MLGSNGNSSGSAREHSNSRAAVAVNGSLSLDSSGSLKFGEGRRKPSIVLGHNHKYKLLDKIEEGSFGNIFLCRDLTSQQLLAVKYAKKCNGIARLRYENEVVTRLASFGANAPVLKPLNMLVYSKFSMLVLPFLGPSLQALSDKLKTLSYPTVRFIAWQMVRCLSFVHEQGFIHRDVSPNNFVIDTDRKVWIINFGLSKPFDKGEKDHAKLYTDIAEGRRINGMNTAPNKMTGTPRFASVNALLGNAQTIQDDLISLGYVILYLLKRDLPWKGCKPDQLEDIKRKFDPRDLCLRKKLSQDAKLSLIKYFQLVNPREGGALSWVKDYDFEHYNKLCEIFKLSAAGSVDKDVKQTFEWEM